MIEAQDMANLAMELGHEAMEQTAQVMSSLMQARRTMVAAHQELAKTRDQIGIPVYAMGSFVHKAEDLNTPATSATPLQAVS